jgi:hypothetical protein
MNLISRLSSQSDDRRGNYSVAAQCIEDPSLIPQIVTALDQSDNKIVIDCAEVLTEIAKVNPVLVSPFGMHIPKILTNKNNRARWEGMHCLAYIANLVPEVVQPLLDEFDEIIRTNESIIVRDYAIDVIGNYSQSSMDAARLAQPILERSLKVWDGRHAGHALTGLTYVAQLLPQTKLHLKEIAQDYLNHPSGVIQKAARKLLKTTQKGD